MAFISVVIPALDDAVMLARCLEALAAQERPADEIIVVDNGSVDDTVTVALASGARVVTEPRRGIPAATAAGFDAARGTIIARLDADSRPAPDWIAEIATRFEHNPGLSAITGVADFYGANALVRKLGKSLYLGGMYWSMTLLLGHPPLFGSNSAITAVAWQRLRTRAHRTLRAVHDDLDLSIQFEPGMRVEYDRDLRVSISARPFGSFRGLGRRLFWVCTTLAVNSRERSLLARRAEYRDEARRSREAEPTFIGEADGSLDYGGSDFGDFELPADS